MFVHQKRSVVFLNRMKNLKIEHEQSILNTQIEIQEKTFQHVSREIHDNINLSLTLVKLKLNTIQIYDSSESSMSIQDSINLLGTTIKDLNDLSRTMNTDLIEAVGFQKVLTQEIDKISKMAGLVIELRTIGEPVFLESCRELVVFRIIQECFNNIVKHARANRIRLTLHYADTFLDITIDDNGIGFENSQMLSTMKQNSSGLRNIFKRVEFFGGQVLIRSQINIGTTLTITLPY